MKVRTKYHRRREHDIEVFEQSSETPGGIEGTGADEMEGEEMAEGATLDRDSRTSTSDGWNPPGVIVQPMPVAPLPQTADSLTAVPSTSMADTPATNKLLQFCSQIVSQEAG